MIDAELMVDGLHMAFYMLISEKTISIFSTIQMSMLFVPRLVQFTVS